MGVSSSDTAAHPWYSLHWGMFALGLFDLAKKNIIFVFILAVKYPGWLIPAVGFGLALFVAIQAFRYFGLQYQLGDDHLRIREGILSKKIRSIPVRRIHNINTSQSLLARMLRVQRLDIETAGGGAAEASFTALSLEAVKDIQRFVRRHKSNDAMIEPESDTMETSQDSVIYRVTPRDLIFAGATTSRLGAILVALGAGFEYFDDKIFEIIPIWRELSDGLMVFYDEKSTPQLALAGATTFVALLFVAWLISIASSFIRWHQFTLGRSGDDLTVSMGLFTRREFAFPGGKIQALRLRASMFRRPFRLFEIRVQTAGHSGMEDDRRVESDMLMPITHLKKADFFVRSVFGKAHWEGIEWQPVHPYTRSRQFRIMAFIYLVLVAAGYVTIGAMADLPITIAALVIGLPLLWMIANFTYKQTAYALEDDFIYIRKGFIGLHFWVIPVNRLQNMAVTQNPFQRRFGLGSLVLDVAGGLIGRDPNITNIPIAKCWKLLNQLAEPSFASGSENK